jgi:hypothetical protein
MDIGNLGPYNLRRGETGPVTILPAYRYKTMNSGIPSWVLTNNSNSDLASAFCTSLC